MKKNETILIIEDDPDIANIIEIHLNDLGYKLDNVSDGNLGLQKALNNHYALIILDIMLPGIGGLEICKEIRFQDKFTPILMLTAKSEEIDKVLGLELGADDYLTKPFSVHELIARIKAIIRRLNVDNEKKSDESTRVVFEYGDLVINLEKHSVQLAQRAIELTAKEFDLLALFAQKPGRVFSRQELLDLVWGYQYSGWEHTVNSHINRLRNKIESDPANPFFIRTVWGVGYRFVEYEELEG